MYALGWYSLNAEPGGPEAESKLAAKVGNDLLACQAINVFAPGTCYHRLKAIKYAHRFYMNAYLVTALHLLSSIGSRQAV